MREVRRDGARNKNSMGPDLRYRTNRRGAVLLDGQGKNSLHDPRKCGGGGREGRDNVRYLLLAIAMGLGGCVTEPQKGRSIIVDCTGYPDSTNYADTVRQYKNCEITPPGVK